MADSRAALNRLASFRSTLKLRLSKDIQCFKIHPKADQQVGVNPDSFNRFFVMKSQQSLLNGRGYSVLRHPVAMTQVLVFGVTLKQGINGFVAQNLPEAFS